MTKLIYIVGIGHCGSTLLDLVLGESEGLVSTSQLNDLLAPYVPESNSPRDVFWRSVLSELPDGGAELSRQNLSIKRERKLLPFVFGCRSLDRYANANGEFLAVLYSKRPEEIVIDSSKNISRALGLLKWNHSGVFALHLVRDLRSYVNSNNMRRTEGGKRSAYLIPALRWYVKNILATLFVRLRAKHYKLVRYEEFLNSPETCLDELSKWLGASLDGSMKTVLDKRPIHPLEGIVFFGNRILQKQEVVFDPQRSKREGVFNSKLFWLLLGWPSRLYGYRFSE